MDQNKHNNSQPEEEIDNHLLYQDEEERKFENVIPEFGTCGGGEVDVSKIGQKPQPQSQ